MKTRCTVLLLAALTGLGARAETSEQKGKRVMEEAVAALGGPAFLAMRDRVESGRAYSFYRENLSGLAVATIYTKYVPPPPTPEPGFLGLRERQALGKKQDDVILFTQDNAYEITFRGARPLPDARLQQFRTSALRNIFYILHERMSEPGMIFDSRGTDFFENRPVEIVDVTDADNNTVTVYFDQLNKLPVRTQFVRRDPINNDRIEEVSLFGKYRDVGGGVMWPFSVRRERQGEKIFEMYAETVGINKGLKDDLFVLPPGLKILKKQN